MRKDFRIRLLNCILALTANLNPVIRSISETELKMFRIQSPLFNFTLPEHNILDLPEDTSTVAVSDGNWVFLYF